LGDLHTSSNPEKMINTLKLVALDIFNMQKIPVAIGGEHTITLGLLKGLGSKTKKTAIVSFDAHLDFVDDRRGVKYGHGNPMRRAAEKKYVTGLTQLGIRNVSSTSKEGYDNARLMGSDFLSVRQVRKLGTQAVLERIPKGSRYYVSIDIDAFDPSIAPGTGTPSHGGFLYYDVLEILQGLAKRGTVVGVDLVEVAPVYDSSDSTQILAAQILINFIGFVYFNVRH